MKQQLQSSLGDKAKDLVSRIQGGDSSLREEFAILILPVVKKVVNRFFRDPHDKLSAANWIVCKILNKISYIDLSKPIVGYIIFTASNHCIDEYRKSKRAKRKATLIYPDNLDELPYEEVMPQFSEDDYLYAYEIITESQDEVDILYDLFNNRLDPKVVAEKYSLSLKEIEKYKSYPSKNLWSITKKLAASQLKV